MKMSLLKYHSFLMRIHSLIGVFVFTFFEWNCFHSERKWTFHSFTCVYFTVGIMLCLPWFWNGQHLSLCKLQSNLWWNNQILIIYNSSDKTGGVNTVNSSQPIFKRRWSNISKLLPSKRTYRAKTNCIKMSDTYLWMSLVRNSTLTTCGVTVKQSNLTILWLFFLHLKGLFQFRNSRWSNPSISFFLQDLGQTFHMLPLFP